MISTGKPVVLIFMEKSKYVQNDRIKRFIA